jgi:hypothetical protein
MPSDHSVDRKVAERNRDKADPVVWCARFRHRIRLTAANNGEPCKGCIGEGLVDVQRAGD